MQGPGRCRFVTGTGPVLGRRGTLVRFRIAIEQDIAYLDGRDVARFVEETYADPRGWTGSQRWRFQRVRPDQPP